MVPVETSRPSPTLSVCKFTAYLTQSQTEPLSPLDLFLLVRDGFAFNDVEAMVSASELYSAAKILRRITGKSARSIQLQKNEGSAARLNAQQSALAFQYAQALEHAASVFGSQRLAEEWLGRPCKHLKGNVPLELIENSLGFQVVEEYLQRMERGGGSMNTWIVLWIAACTAAMLQRVLGRMQWPETDGRWLLEGGNDNAA